MSSEIFLPMSEKKKRPKKRGDSALLDRLNRARGAYLERTGKDVELQELAKAAGLGASTMTDIMTLDRRVTIADALAFADYLGVEFAWLAAGRGPMRAPPVSDREGHVMESIIERRPDTKRQGHRA